MHSSHKFLWYSEQIRSQSDVNNQCEHCLAIERVNDVEARVPCSQISGPFATTFALLAITGLCVVAPQEGKNWVGAPGFTAGCRDETMVGTVDDFREPPHLRGVRQLPQTLSAEPRKEAGPWQGDALPPPTATHGNCGGGWHRGGGGHLRPGAGATSRHACIAPSSTTSLGWAKTSREGVRH